MSAERDEIESESEEGWSENVDDQEKLPSLIASTPLSLPPSARAQLTQMNDNVYLSTRARRSELLRASPPWETRRRWSEPLLPEAARMPPEVEGQGRSTDVRPPLVFVPVLVLVLPLTRMGWIFSF